MMALGRAGLPEDIGPMIASLLSEENRWVNAQRIEVSRAPWLFRGFPVTVSGGTRRQFET
jgi:NAD(P)-dependent dehydrogenase (short-subunit alcohol dehydrogenase family)